MCGCTDPLTGQHAHGKRFPGWGRDVLWVGAALEVGSGKQGKLRKPGQKRKKNRKRKIGIRGLYEGQTRGCLAGSPRAQQGRRAETSVEVTG